MSQVSNEKYHDKDENGNWPFVKRKIVCKINLFLISTKPGCYHSDQVEVKLDSANTSLDKPRPGQTQFSKRIVDSVPLTMKSSPWVYFPRLTSNHRARPHEHWFKFFSSKALVQIKWIRFEYCEKKQCENPFVDFFLLQLSHTPYNWESETCILDILGIAFEVFTSGKKMSKLLTVVKNYQTYWHLMCHIIQELLKAINSSFELSKLSKVLIELRHQIPKFVVQLATFGGISFSCSWNNIIKKWFAQLIGLSLAKRGLYVASKKSLPFS